MKEEQKTHNSTTTNNKTLNLLKNNFNAVCLIEFITKKTEPKFFNVTIVYNILMQFLLSTVKKSFVFDLVKQIICEMQACSIRLL